MRSKSRRLQLPIPKDFFLSLLNGTESGLATTTAILVGLYITTESKTVIVATAIISMMVQAWNSAMSTISQEHVSEIIDHPYARQEHYWQLIATGATQFLSHILAGLIPIVPILLINNVDWAIAVSISAALVLLFVAGLDIAKVIKRSRLKGALENVITGSLVIAVGLLAGLVLS